MKDPAGRSCGAFVTDDQMILHFFRHLPRMVVSVEKMVALLRERLLEEFFIDRLYHGILM